ncbi:hypothetical protein [Nocardia asiatica]|uniref:hypothetical protein n=1 Tax=Nocardia asiatica TaxID=209252 RepID=UPI002455883B|nr:hypothetical protein [Nocardia asiatica]
MNLFDAVATFNRACDVRLLDEPGWVSDDELALALRLIDEETSELVAALTSRDLIEVADAIADTMYVTAGLVLRIGGRSKMGDSDYLIDITHRAPGWHVYDLDWADMWPDKARSEAGLLRSAVDKREHGLTCAYARIVLSSCALLGGVLALPMRSVFAEVQRSNMSKVVDGRVIRREDGKIAKPDTFTPPDVAGVLARHGWKAA